MKQLFYLSGIAAVCCSFVFCGNNSTANEITDRSSSSQADSNIRPTGMKDPNAESYSINLQTLTDVDLWIMKIDGSGDKLFVKNGLGPSWSK